MAFILKRRKSGYGRSIGEARGSPKISLWAESGAGDWCSYIFVWRGTCRVGRVEVAGGCEGGEGGLVVGAVERCAVGKKV